MAKVELLMPKMGESIIEATIIKWVKSVGDSIEEDETILEIATDKVDSEIPSPVDGIISKILFQEDDIVKIGEVIAIIETEATEQSVAQNTKVTEGNKVSDQSTSEPTPLTSPQKTAFKPTRFYSPLVKSMAKAENIGIEELEQVPGTGKDNRVTKRDMLAYIDGRKNKPQMPPQKSTPKPQVTYTPPAVSIGSTDQIIEMDRTRRLIAQHMVASKQTAPHVTSFVEADVTNIVNWRKAMKPVFQERYSEKITFTPIFIEAIAKALQEFPMVNISVDSNNIIVKKNINIGMATAMHSGNLIVPVIKDANHKNLVGLTKSVNDLAARARANRLKPDEIQGGTFTLTNVGTFGNLSGTPIINQPQVAILSVGVIKKKPAVVETKYGDVIAIRHLMMMSMSYDHRVVDGMLGGSFLRRVADHLELFDVNRTV